MHLLPFKLIKFPRSAKDSKEDAILKSRGGKQGIDVTDNTILFLFDLAEVLLQMMTVINKFGSVAGLNVFFILTNCSVLINEKVIILLI